MFLTSYIRDTGQKWPGAKYLLATITGVLVTLLATTACIRSSAPITPSPKPVDVENFRVLLSDSRPHSTANIRVVDLAGDNSTQVLVSEVLRGEVTWVRSKNDTVVLAQGLGQPVRTSVADMDRDGDKDILVSDIGSFFQTDDPVGRVLLLTNDGSNRFEQQVLLEGIGRVTCAENGDLDGDGDLDIVVCVFGHTNGKVIWLEQKPGLVFEEHLLDPRPGAIHAFPFDADGDGDLDIAVALSQLSEEVLLFRNNGNRQFTKEVLFKAPFDYYGLSGIELADLDRDGDTDILFTNGDTFEAYEIPSSIDPNELHGIAWLENTEDQFIQHEIQRIWGPYSVRTYDFDGDSDLDLLVSTFQVSDFFPNSRIRGLVWLENDGQQAFIPHTVDVDMPARTVSIEVADMDGDGTPEVITGTLDHEGGSSGHRLVIFNLLMEAISR